LPDFDIQGHRGARGLLPENSLPGFEKALELGVNTLEMDVVISRDEQVVVSHDPFFSSKICRMPNGDPVPKGEEKSLLVFQLDYEDIRSFDCGTVRQEQFPRQQLRPVRKPLLSEVFEMAEEYTRRHDRLPARYNIETKCTVAGDGEMHPPPHKFAALLIAAIQEGGVSDRTTIQSFDPRTLSAARELAPDLTLSLLVDRGGPPVQDVVAAMGFVPQIVSPDFRLVDADFVRLANEIGMAVLPWTVNDRLDMLRMAQLQVDGIITDYPDVAVELFSRSR
jgi:glycerophosphoryl diester phosphodiesterase